ncbi:MAG: thioester domain-containing protein [Micromonosporaceae bacterium]
MLSVLRGSHRALSLAAVTAAAMLTLAAPAYADPVHGDYVGHEAGTESKVKLKKGGENSEQSTSLLRLKVAGGQTLLTYCIDIHTRVQKTRYDESSWSETQLGDKAKYVNWILHHSVPFVGAEQLAKDAGLSETPSRADAVAGTQAAIWHYSDGYHLRIGDNKPVVEDIYQYLTGDKNTGMENEPAPALSLSPEQVTGEPGKLLGPISVTTSAKTVDVALADAPEGAKLLGPDKKTEVTTAKDGDKLWVSIPAGAEDGTAKVTADATSKVSPGRVFIAKMKAQKLILADSEDVKVHDEAELSWAKVPTAAPGSKSETVCKPNAGVKLTITNEGDAPAEFTVTYGDTTETETVEGGEAKWKVVPVKEDTAYKITVKSGEYEKVYEGTLDCLPNAPKPTPSGGGGDLPNTGNSGLTTILGLGGALLLAGMVLLFVVRQRRRPSADQA